VCMHKGYSRRITSFPLPDIEFAVPKLFRDVEDRSAVHSEQGWAGTPSVSSGVLQGTGASRNRAARPQIRCCVSLTGSLGKSNGVLPKHEDLGTRRRWVDVQMGDRSPFDS